MDLLNLKSSNNAAAAKDISHYNLISEELWFWLFGAVAAIVVLAVALYLLKMYIQGPIYKNAKRLDDKVVIITGCNRGLGRECALELAKRGAKVYMACRNFEKCEQARLDIIKASQNTQIYNRTLDLSSLQSVRKFVTDFLKEEQRLDILVNNAATLNKTRQLTTEGFELNLAINYLGHFLLTQLLMERLKASAPSRIIILTSSPYLWPVLNKQDLQSVNSFCWPKAFLQSKFCNTLYMFKLAELLRKTQVTVNCIYPGLVRTELLYDNISRLLHPLLNFFAKSPKAGAQTALFLALADELKDKSGGIYHNMRECFVPSWSKNPRLAEWLWQESIKLVGLNSDAD